MDTCTYSFMQHGKIELSLMIWTNARKFPVYPDTFIFQCFLDLPEMFM